VTKRKHDLQLWGFKESAPKAIHQVLICDESHTSELGPAEECKDSDKYH